MVCIKISNRSFEILFTVSFCQGYILDGFPVMDENLMKLRDQMESMKNWPLTPDYVVNIRIPDNDLINRREGQRIDPITGTLYIKEQYAPTPVEKKVSLKMISH